MKNLLVLNPEIEEIIKEIDEFYNSEKIIKKEKQQYDFSFTQLTPDKDKIVSRNIEAIADKALENLRGKHLPSNAKIGNINIYEKEDYEAFASHPVYRMQISKGDSNTLIDAVIKIGDSPKEIEAYNHFEKFNDIKTLKAIFNDSLKGKNMIATEYLKGENLTEAIARDDPQKYNFILKSVEQMVKIQERGKEIEGLLNVAEEDPDYFMKRVDNTFIRNFRQTAKEWITEESIKKIENIQNKIQASYKIINKKLIQDSLENGVMYTDSSPMNLRNSDESMHVMDLAGRRIMTGLISLVSLAEFGKKNVSEKDLANGTAGYLDKEQIENMIDVYLLRKAAETAECPQKKDIEKIISSKGNIYENNDFSKFVSEEERQDVHVKYHYAAVQRHLEYTGYAARDIKNASAKERRNEFNRQRYHIRSAIKHLKDVVITDRNLEKDQMKDLVTLLYSLQEMSNIIESQDIKTISYKQEIYDKCPPQIISAEFTPRKSYRIAA